ncbi:MAG: hypothetical protein GY701_28250, partial [Sulfitobacter sp.]|nr:hypothetical protein [Sulfitobacter sp.]
MSDLIDRLERAGPDDEVMVLTGAEAAALREKHPWHAHRIRAVTEPTISSPRGDLYVAEGVTA